MLCSLCVLPPLCSPHPHPLPLPPAAPRVSARSPRPARSCCSGGRRCGPDNRPRRTARPDHERRSTQKQERVTHRSPALEPSTDTRRSSASTRTRTPLARLSDPPPSSLPPHPPPMSSLLARRAVATVARKSAASASAAARPAVRAAAAAAVSAASATRSVSTSSPALFTARGPISASSPTPTSRPANTAPLYGWWGFTPEQEALRELVAKFAAKEIAPRAADIDRNNEFPADLWTKFGELGLLGITVSEEDGGQNTDTSGRGRSTQGDCGCARQGDSLWRLQLIKLCSLCCVCRPRSWLSGARSCD